MDMLKMRPGYDYFTVVSPNGLPSRVVEYDRATYEGTVWYVLGGTTLDRDDPLTIYGPADFGHRLGTWISDGCTLEGRPLIDVFYDAEEETEDDGPYCPTCELSLRDYDHPHCTFDDDGECVTCKGAPTLEA